MPLRSELRVLEEDLQSTARAAIIASMMIAWDRCRRLGNNPEEPDMLASLLLEGMPRLNDAWGTLLRSHGIHLSLLGVYCHQTPQVEFDLSGRRTRCELGDLLVCHRHTQLGGDHRMQALLFQAKSSSAQPYHVKGREESQLRLYTDWPAFTYATGPLKSQVRQVMPRASHRGAQYMLIDDRPPEEPLAGMMGFPGTYPIGVSMPDTALNDHSALDRELVHLLFALSGRAVAGTPSPAAADGWSQVVWDLLRVSIRKTFRRKRSGIGSAPRTAALDGAWFVAGNADLDQISSSLFGDGSHEPPAEEDRPMDDQGWSPSLLLIGTSEAETEVRW